MKISAQKNSITFTSTPLHRVKIPKLVNRAELGHVNAIFSELSPKKYEDVIAVEKIKQTWDDNLVKSSFCANFLYDFSNPKKASSTKYYCIETIENKKLAERIVSLISSRVEPNKNSSEKPYFLSWILTKPEYRNNNPDRTMKDIGEISLGAIINDAKEKNATSFNIFALDKDFFKKTFEVADLNIECNYNCFSLNKYEFEKYLNYIKKTFGINFSQKN